MSNLFSLLDKSACQFADGGAVFRGTEQLLTWNELRSRALRLAAGIRRRCDGGDRIALISENRPEYVELMFAAWAAEAAIVPINCKLHENEVTQIVDDCGAALIFVSPSLAAGLQRSSSLHRDRMVVIGEAAYEALLAHEPLVPPVVVPQTLAWLFYTSGTTGRSKGAMLSHRNLLAMTIAHLADVESLDERSSQIHAAPMSHGSGVYVLPSVARGARQVVPASGGFDPVEFLELCDHHPACGAFLAPTLVQRLRLAVQEDGRTPPRGLRSIVYGGGPMYVEEMRKSLAVFGPVFTQIYGQGEAPMTITSLNRAAHGTDDDAVLGSVGWPRSGVDVRVVDPDGSVSPAGAVGEIVCRGDIVMAGYWRNPAATSEALHGGWLRTGDMGSFDEHGCLTLRGRSKDVVISGGSNIYPREVEEVLLAHPGVDKACVVGRSDTQWGEVVVAFVVRAPGAEVSAALLDAHCLDRIARFKRPKEYHFVDELPTSSHGKVLKSELRRLLASN